MDFSHIKKFSVQEGKSTDVRLEGLFTKADAPSCVVLHVLPMHRSNKKFLNTLVGSEQSFQKLMADAAPEKGEASPEATKAFLTFLVDALIVGWEHIFDAQGEPVEFSPERAVALLMQEPDVFSNAVVVAANDLRRFFPEDSVKKSLRSSAGSSATAKTRGKSKTPKPKAKSSRTGTSKGQRPRSKPTST